MPLSSLPLSCTRLGFGIPGEEWIPGPNILDYETAPEVWTRHTSILSLTGTKTVVIHGAGVRGNAYDWVDKLVIQQSDVLTVTGLVEGQKVELYRSSDDALLDTQTCAAGETSIQFLDLSAEDCPCQMYLIIYATDGATLIETTPSYDMCGGDTWEWTADAGTLTIASDVLIIYRGAASASPKTTAITANLKTIGGAEYPGALIYFYASNGLVSDASDTTDVDGNAHTTLSSLTNTQGIAIVKAQWLGDANVPACSVYVTVHVFYEAEVPDSTQDFQLYIEGYPVSFVSGRYGVNAQGKPEDFEAEIPEWDDNITPYGVVSIYRKGVQEFAGIYLKPERTLTDSPRVVLTGSDLTYLLSDRVCDLKIYSAKTPQYMIADLLSTFPCGITAGSLGSSPDSLTLTVDTENLLAAIQRICDNVYWSFRVNLNRTLDFAERFGGTPSGLTFVEGMDILSLDRSEDYTQLKNWVRMRGDGISQHETRRREHHGAWTSSDHIVPAINQFSGHARRCLPSSC